MTREECKRYFLLIDREEIARVTMEGGDFPGHWGHFELLDGVEENPALSHVLNYIERSVSSDPGEGGEDRDGEWENDFIDLIEPSKWWLVDAGGGRKPILVPIFLKDHEITWRNDVGRR
jgi:hypothetical protein